MKKNTQIILFISRARKLPKTLELTTRQWRLRLLGLVMLAISVSAGLGAALTWFLVNPDRQILVEINQLREHNRQQKTDLVQMHQNLRRQLDALALRLGQLQAQSTRLNALGERLTQIGKLDTGEFNFNQTPPVGGLEDVVDNSQTVSPSLEASINQLANEFDVQQEQLSVLQSLLINARIDSDLKPTGMPVRGGYISSWFGPRRDPFTGHLAFHMGLDIAAPIGTPIQAVAEGMVTFAGRRSGYGNMVEINHGNGYHTRYAHDSVLLVHPGQRVHVGQLIARIGSTGRSTGPHVHFEVWYKGRVVNPLPYVRSHR